MIDWGGGGTKGVVVLATLLIRWELIDWGDLAGVGGRGLRDTVQGEQGH